jgi:integrase
MRPKTPALYARLGKDEGYKWARISFGKNGRAVAIPGATSYFLKGTFKVLENGQPIIKRVIPAGKDLQEAVITLHQYEAAPAAAELIKDFQNNHVPAKPAPTGSTPGLMLPTLQKAVDEFLDGLKTKKPGTIMDYRNQLNHLLAFYGPDKPLAEFNRATLLKYRDELYRQDLSDTTRHNRLNLAVILLNRFKIEGLLEKGDWPKPNKNVPDAYSREEIKAMLDAAETEKERLLIETFLFSGARDMEIAHMVVGDIKITKHKKEEIAVLNIRAKSDWTTKSKEDRRIRIPLEFAKRLLAAYENSSENALLFPNTRGGPNTNLLKIVKKIAKDAKVQGASLHKFRRTYATFKQRTGTDIQSLKVSLGHKSVTTTMRYLEAGRAESEMEGKSTEAAFGDLVTVGA